MMRLNLVGLILASMLPAAAALPATTVWETRAGVGSANNGACFNSAGTGTDYSQQNAAQYTAADLVLVTTTTVSSASHSFVAADVGNCIHITAGTGFTADWYVINSTSAGVATLDRAAGTMGSTGGTYFVGGAAASPTDFSTKPTQGNIVWMKASGTYTFTVTMSIATNGGSGAQATSVKGYTTTRGDRGAATVTTATNSTVIFTLTNNGKIDFYNLLMSNTAGTRAAGFGLSASAQILLANVTMDGFSTGVSGNGANSCYLYLVEVKNSTGDGVSCGSGGNTSTFFCQFCYIHGNGDDGLDLSIGAVNPFWCVSCVIAGNTGYGINFGSNAGNQDTMRGGLYDSVLASNGNSGLRTIADDFIPFSFSNVIFWNNGGYGAESTGSPPGYLCICYSNAYGSNTSGARLGWPASLNGDLTLTADPFTNAAAGDYSLNNTAGGGAVVKATGFPGNTAQLNFGGFGTGFSDVGALQSSGGSPAASPYSYAFSH